MKYLIFYLQFHKKVTEVALCGVWFAVSGISPRFKIRREYKKRDEGRVFIRETAEKRRTPRIMPTHSPEGPSALLCKCYFQASALWTLSRITAWSFKTEITKMRFYKAWLYLCYNLYFHKSVFRKVADTDAGTCRFWWKILTVNFVKRTEIGYVFKEAGCLNYAVKISSCLFQNRSDIFANSFGLTLNCIFFYVAVCRVYCYLPRSKEKSINDFALWIRSYCGRCRWSVKCFLSFVFPP